MLKIDEIDKYIKMVRFSLSVQTRLTLSEFHPLIQNYIFHFLFVWRKVILMIIWWLRVDIQVFLLRRISVQNDASKSISCFLRCSNLPNFYNCFTRNTNANYTSLPRVHIHFWEHSPSNALKTHIGYCHPRQFLGFRGWVEKWVWSTNGKTPIW